MAKLRTHIACPGLKPGWADPFACTVKVKEGRSTRRFYRLGPDMDYPGVTTILGGDPPAWAWSTWVADEAKRLHALAIAGVKDLKWEAVWTESGLEWCSSEVDPADLLQGDWLKDHGQRMQSRAADRGTVVEMLLEDWKTLGYIGEDDIEHWVNNKLCEYKADGTTYRCHVSEVLPYAVQLRRFLEENAVEIKATSILVCHEDLKYATVIDLWAMIDGELWSLNLKTSAATTRKHAEQIAAEVNATHFIPQGSQEALPLAPVRRGMTPGVLLVTQDSATLRRLKNTPYWFRSFKAAHRRYLANLADMPFASVQKSKAVAA